VVRNPLLLLVVEQYLANSHTDDAPYDRLAEIVVVIVVVIAATPPTATTTDIDVAIDIDIPTPNVDIPAAANVGIPDTPDLSAADPTGISDAPGTTGLPGMTLGMFSVAGPETAAILAFGAAALATTTAGLSGDHDFLGGHHVIDGQHEFSPTRVFRQRRTLDGLRISNGSLQRWRRQRSARDQRECGRPDRYPHHHSSPFRS
jgi:hypothetical protein